VFPTTPSGLGQLPVWLQLLICIPIALATIGAAWRGYRGRLEREPPGAATTVLAAIPDMGAVRNLNEECRILAGHIESLNRTLREHDQSALAVQIESLSVTLRDHTHYLRDKIEVDREVCQRLRELKEEIVRSDQQRWRRGPTHD
jgi:hypothetical protein